ncbi:MAG: histidine kinase [Candidatus Azobacteroides sp.]|nr:histidine kinase [Candidatus Azobacteroides sp.]
MEPGYRVVRHAFLFITLFFISLDSAFMDNPAIYDKWEFYVYLLFIWISYIASVYFNLYFLIPRYLLKKKYELYFSFVCLFVALEVLFLFLWEFSYFYFMLDSPRHLSEFSFLTVSGHNRILTFILDFISTFFLNLIAFMGGAITVLLKSWVTGNKRKGELEKKHLESELENLKEIVNPSFLFTILRRIRNLEEKDSCKAEKTLMQFSRMLRYQLYDCNYELVFLNAEIRFIRNYLELEKLHYEKLEFTIASQEEINSLLVPPLLFIPFIYCLVTLLEDSGQFAQINLKFKGNRKELYFVYTGTLSLDISNSAIRNLKQRMDVLFGKRYSLKISSLPEDYFQVSLYIEFHTV